MYPNKPFKTFSKDEMLNLEKAPIIWVYPEELDYVHTLDRSVPISLSGDWDLHGKPFTKCMIYESFKHRLEGSKWEDTRFYKHYNRQPNWYGLTQLDYWDSMLQDIVINGYTHKPIKDHIDNYMSILIGRNGRMVIYNGIHRYACCLLSPAIQKIPVKVLARHSQWQEFKDSCIEFQKNIGKLYSQLPHPDLESIPFHYNSERTDLIAKHSLFPKGTITDIGARFGITSYGLAQNGFKVKAIEKVKEIFTFMEKISKFPGKSFTPINADFATLTDEADTLVMLNIAHHFTPNMTRFLQFLERSSYKEIFYQAHALDNKWTAYITPKEYLKLIVKATKMSKTSELTEIGGRKLWHLTRS